MSAKAHYFRIGLFVLIGAGLFVAALFAVGLKAYFGQRDIFETYVPGKVENLSAGALVKLRGVNIGKVSAIEFIGAEYPRYHQRYVLIQFEVPRGTVWNAETNHIQELLDTEAAQGLRARVEAQGFIGASILALEYVDPTLYPVEPVPWTPKHYYIPSAPSQFNRLGDRTEANRGRRAGCSSGNSCYFRHPPSAGTASLASQTRNRLPCQRRRCPLPCPEEELSGTCGRTWNRVLSARAESPRHFRPQQLVQAKRQWAITRGNPHRKFR